MTSYDQALKLKGTFPNDIPKPLKLKRASKRAKAFVRSIKNSPIDIRNCKIKYYYNNRLEEEFSIVAGTYKSKTV